MFIGSINDIRSSRQELRRPHREVRLAFFLAF